MVIQELLKTGDTTMIQLTKRELNKLNTRKAMVEKFYLPLKNISRKIWHITEDFIILWCQINTCGEAESSAAQAGHFLCSQLL